MCSLETEKNGRIYLCDSDPERRLQIQEIANRLGLDFEFIVDESHLAMCAASTRPGCLIVSDACLAQAEQSSGRPISDFQAFSSGGRMNLVGHGVATIVICQHPEVNQVVRYMRAGARTVLPMPLATDELTQEISDAIDVDRVRVRTEERLENIRAIYNNLADRKRLVLQHMIDGRPSKWSAHDLDVSRRTIELDRAEILHNFGVNNAIELARLMVETKCLPLNYSHLPNLDMGAVLLAK